MVVKTTPPDLDDFRSSGKAIACQNDVNWREEMEKKIRANDQKGFRTWLSKLLE